MKKFDIMIVSGGFDPMHRGHVRLFKAAKNMAHKVIIGLNSDRWLVKKKGKVFMSYGEREEILKALQYVDEIMAFDDTDGTAVDLLARVQRLYPNCLLAFGNGGDRNINNVPERGMCNAYGIEMIWRLGGGKVQSSSDLTKRYKNTNN